MFLPLLVALAPTPLISHVPRAKHTVQQPPGYPVGPVLAIGIATIKQRLRERAGTARDLHHSPALVVWFDVVPEERGTSVLVGAYAVEEI